MELAAPDDPYIKTDGTVLEAAGTSEATNELLREDRKVLPLFSKINTVQKASIEDLPEPDYQQQTVIAAVVGLKLLGLTDVDIVEILDTDLEAVQRIVEMPATQITFEKMYQNLIHANSNSAQGRIASYANTAVDTVVGLMQDVDIRDDVRLKAAQDVLDRSGTHPDQFFGDGTTSNQSDDELRIVILDEETGNEKVRVEVKKGK